MGIEREDSINSFRHISPEEVNLVKACCRLLEGLDHIAEADGLMKLVRRMDGVITSLEDRLETRDMEVDELMSAVDELQDELGMGWIGLIS